MDTAAHNIAVLPTPHPKLRVAKPADVPDAAWLAELDAWLAVPVRMEDEVKAALRRWVPEYRTPEEAR